MSYVVSLYDFRPGARYDDVPWTEARIEEAPASTGPWTQIDVQALDPIDSDPKNPQSRNFTTGEATQATGWYRVIFADATDALQQSDPVYFPGVGGRLPTLAELGAYANVAKPEKQPLLQTALDAALDHVRGIPRQIDLLPALSSDDPVTIERQVKGRRLIRVPDAREVTAVELDGTATTDYKLRTCRAPTAVWVALDEDVDLCGVKTAEVTGRFGMDPLPDELRQAILALALRRYREREIGDGTSGMSDEYGVRSLPPFPAHTFKAYAVDSVFVA